jgi:anoctamin-10/anoctamin-7
MADEEKDNLRGDSYTWDYCIVLRIPGAGDDEKDAEDEEPPPVTGPMIVDRIRKAKLHTKMYLSAQEDEVYCLIGADEVRLEAEADRIDMDLELEPTQAVEIAFKNGVRLAKHTKERDEKCVLISDDIWSNIYGPFDRDAEKKALFKIQQDSGPHEGSVFKDTDRINLIQSILEAKPQFGGAGLALTKLYKLKNTHLLAAFPLHNPKKKKELSEKWLFWGVKRDSPLDEIRDYFGEKVALYFSFLEFYTRMLILPTVCGLVFFILQLTADSIEDAKGLYIFAFIVIFWCTAFGEVWKRKEARHRLNWGMLNFIEKEQTRPEFVGEYIRSPINGNLEAYFPFVQKVIRAIASQSVVISFILLVLASVTGMFIFRFYLRTETSLGDTMGKVIGGILNSLQIQIFNQIYGRIVYALNEYENHRTDTEYENALIAKSFLFKFVNSYNSLFYLAFFRGYLDNNVCVDANGDALDNCLNDLRIQLAIIFTSLIVMNNSLEVGIPYLKSQIKAKKEAKGLDLDEVNFTFPEIEYSKEQYESTFDDFDELAIQYGFVTLFVVAFPLTPLLAFLNNILEVRVDSVKLLTVTRRPEPRGAANIGTWYDIFTIISYIAIITNIVIVVFQASEIESWTGSAGNAQAWIAIITEHLVICMKFAVEYFVPDIPEDVLQHMERQEYLVNVLLKDFEEEDDEDEFITAETQGISVDPDMVNFTIEQIPKTLDALDEHMNWTEADVKLPKALQNGDEEGGDSV